MFKKYTMLNMFSLNCLEAYCLWWIHGTENVACLFSLLFLLEMNNQPSVIMFELEQFWTEPNRSLLIIIKLRCLLMFGKIYYHQRWSMQLTDFDLLSPRSSTIGFLKCWPEVILLSVNKNCVDYFWKSARDQSFCYIFFLF